MAKTLKKTEAAEKPAKNAKTTEAPAEKKKAPPQPEKPKWGVPELAKVLGIAEASVRVKLRNAGIEKTGKNYDFETKENLNAVADKLRGEKADTKAETAPAKKKKAA